MLPIPIPRPNRDHGLRCRSRMRSSLGSGLEVKVWRLPVPQSDIYESKWKPVAIHGVLLDQSATPCFMFKRHISLEPSVSFPIGFLSSSFLSRSWAIYTINLFLSRFNSTSNPRSMVPTAVRRSLGRLQYNNVFDGISPNDEHVFAQTRSAPQPDIGARQSHSKLLAEWFLISPPFTLGFGYNQPRVDMDWAVAT